LQEGTGQIVNLQNLFYNGGMKDVGLPKTKRDNKFTYKEYCSWPDDERWELIDGLAYDMSPAPSSRHQKISFKLSTQIGVFLQNISCDAFSAPFDVMLPMFPIKSEDEIDTVVQPDTSVICDPSKIIEKGCLGAPDLIVEILSPSTSKKDLNEKFQLYEKHGVKEYWVVDPGNKYISVFHLLTEGKDSGKYDDGTLVPPANWREDKNTIAESVVLKGFTVDVKELFDSLG
jgi:Uma2 family endonuclease